MSHPLPFQVPWFPRFALLEIPFLLPRKLLLILESPLPHSLLQEALSPTGADGSILPAGPTSGFKPKELLVVQL